MCFVIPTCLSLILSRGFQEPSVCQVTGRCHRKSSGDPQSLTPKASCVFGGGDGGDGGRNTHSLDVKMPSGFTKCNELKSSGER